MPSQTSHGKAWRQGCTSGCSKAEAGMWDRVFLHVPPDPILPPPVTGLGVLFPPGWAFSLLLIQGFLHLWDAPQERELPQVPSRDQGCILPGLHDCSKIPSHPKLFWDMLGCVGSQTPVSPVCGIPPRLAVLCRGRMP